MKKLSCFLIFLSISVFGQRVQNEMPSFLYNLNISDVPINIFDSISNNEIRNKTLNDGTPASGKIFHANLNLKNASRLDSVSEIEGIYRLCIKSDSASSIDIVLENLILEDEEEVWFYNQYVSGQAMKTV